MATRHRVALEDREEQADTGRSAWKKLAILNAAIAIGNLKIPPGNRLEALSGDRKGQYSIRIKDQFRICFRWFEANAHDVVLGKRSISADTALRFGVFFGLPALFWLNLQNDYDLRLAASDDLKKIKPHKAA